MKFSDIKNLEFHKGTFYNRLVLETSRPDFEVIKPNWHTSKINFKNGRLVWILPTLDEDVSEVKAAFDKIQIK